jgi:hypothetical protein
MLAYVVLEVDRTGRSGLLCCCVPWVNDGGLVFSQQAFSCAFWHKWRVPEFGDFDDENDFVGGRAVKRQLRADIRCVTGADATDTPIEFEPLPVSLYALSVLCFSRILKGHPMGYLLPDGLFR